MAKLVSSNASKVRKAPKVSGYVFYRGPSMIDGKPIIAIATGFRGKASTNAKTGAMVQTWIMREDIKPMEALDTGDDVSICGNCPHRGIVVDGKNKHRACYVLVHQAPRNVWQTEKNGKYPTATLDQLGELFANRTVRLGSYGDPAAVPMEVWDAMLSQTKAHTGYTHQWDMKNADGKLKFKALARYVMASADSHQDKVKANMYGFRTFRVTGIDSRQDKLSGEVICHASKEMGNKTSCAACVACGGTKSKTQKNVVITVHGASNKKNAYKEMQKSVA